MNTESIKQHEIIFWKLFNTYNTDNILLFFCDIYRNGLKERKSLFNERGKISKSKMKYQIIEDNYHIEFSCDVKNTDHELILKDLQITFDIPVKYVKIEKLKKFLVLLIENGINGFLTSPFDKENLIRAEQNCVSIPGYKKIENLYICNECKKSSKQPNGF